MPNQHTCCSVSGVSAYHGLEIGVFSAFGLRWIIRGMPNFCGFYTRDYPLPVRDTNADGDVYH